MRLGCDPEVFLQDDHNNLVSSIGYIKAGKEHPFQIPGMREGFTLQEDNVALEFGIPPASSQDEFVRSIKKVMQKGLSKCEGMSFSKLSCSIFPEKELEHPLAQSFGCEPDLNAWTLKENDKPTPPNKRMRSAGGHVHIETKLNPYYVGRAADLFLGIPSVIMDRATERRQFYGKAGSVRVKPYGVEYRTLSNFWIFDENYIRWVWRNSKRTLDFVSRTTEEDQEEFERHYGRLLQDCINNNNIKEASQLIKEWNLDVC